jgi:hypothetical protein
MALWDIASGGESERARVGDLMGLADIFLLRSKSIDDLRKGLGWTDEATEEFAKTRIIPDRIYLIAGDRTVG